MSDEMSRPVVLGEITPQKLRDLLDLYEKSSRGTWKVETQYGDRGYVITNFNRTALGRPGPIAFVSGDYLAPNKSPYSETTSYTSKKIDGAEYDAKIIAAAVNIIKPLCEAFLNDHQLSESYWLIEWPADKHYPLRYYYGNGSPPVMDVNDAVRFFREQDARATAKDMKLMAGYRITEHKSIKLPKGDL